MDDIMTCVKTGCDVRLDSHGAILHGDMFLVGGVYILHHCGEDTMRWGGDMRECDYVFHDGYDDEWISSAEIIAIPCEWVRSNV
jgi:hypothetical protein